MKCFTKSLKTVIIICTFPLDPVVIPMVVAAAVGPRRVTVHPALEVAVLAVVRVTLATVVTNINHAMCSSREIRLSTSYHFHEFYRSNGYPGKLYTMTDKILTSHEAKGCEIGRRDLADIQSKSAKEDSNDSFVLFQKFLITMQFRILDNLEIEFEYS